MMYGRQRMQFTRQDAVLTVERARYKLPQYVLMA